MFALPVPEYTRRDGVLNLAAHFMVNCGAKPDLGMCFGRVCTYALSCSHYLGPKVYMALKSKQEDGYSGSTRLHCDLCDAINIMVFSSPSSGTALWHIFRAADSHKIRAFIRRFYNCTLDDPIHSQHYYFGPSDLEALGKHCGVVPYTIHQKVGEAVFIPAGCAHQVSGLLTMISASSSHHPQVSNEAHCIKVASDFLSVEAIAVCKMLAGEFRQKDLRDTWKDNVLQLNFQLYCAWLSLQRPLEDSRTPFAFISESLSATPCEAEVTGPDRQHQLSLQPLLEDSQTPFAFTISEPPSPMSHETEVTAFNQQDAGKKAKCGADQPVRKKARHDVERRDRRPRFRCHLCPPEYRKSFLDHGLRNHL